MIPVLPAGGCELLTLRDAADHIMKLPKAEQDLEEWQIAVARSRRAKAEPSRAAPSIADSIQNASEKPGSKAGLIPSIYYGQ
jgi:hypothetical protein